MLNWEWYSKPNMVQFYVHILLKANHAPGRWRGFDISRGQLITGLHTLSNETGLTIRQIRTCIKNLKTSGELTSKVTNKFSILTICNYETYQDDLSAGDKPNDRPLTSKRQASDKQATTNKKNKNNNKDNIGPLRMQLIQIFTPNPRQNRSTRETTAWNKIKGDIHANEVDLLTRFYAEPKNTDFDSTWHRKGTLITLLNNYSEQVEIAQTFYDKKDNDRDGPDAHGIREF